MDILNMRYQDAPLEDRLKVFLVYSKYLMEKEGQKVTFQDCECGWYNCRWMMIKYTFGIEENLNRKRG